MTIPVRKQPTEAGRVRKSSPSESGPVALPTWTTATEALAVCLHRPNRRCVGLIAGVVGTLLVGINLVAVLA